VINILLKILSQVSTRNYPPFGHWIYESKEIHDLWAKHLEEGKLPDDHKPRLPHMLVDLTRLATDLPPDRSAVFMEGDVFRMVVHRNFCGREDVVKWVDDVVRAGVAVKKSIWVCVIAFNKLFTKNPSSWKTQESFALLGIQLDKETNHALTG